MKLKLAYTVTYSLLIVSLVLLFLFFHYGNAGQAQLSNNCFISGFLCLCFTIVLFPTQPNKFANPKGLRVKYYNLLSK